MSEDSMIARAVVAGVGADQKSRDVWADACLAAAAAQLFASYPEKRTFEHTDWKMLTPIPLMPPEKILLSPEFMASSEASRKFLDDGIALNIAPRPDPVVDAWRRMVGGNGNPGDTEIILSAFQGSLEARASMSEPNCPTKTPVDPARASFIGDGVALTSALHPGSEPYDPTKADTTADLLDAEIKRRLAAEQTRDHLYECLRNPGRLLGEPASMLGLTKSCYISLSVEVRDEKITSIFSANGPLVNGLPLNGWRDKAIRLEAERDEARGEFCILLEKLRSACADLNAVTAERNEALALVEQFRKAEQSWYALDVERQSNAAHAAQTIDSLTTQCNALRDALAKFTDLDVKPPEPPINHALRVKIGDPRRMGIGGTG